MIRLPPPETVLDDHSFYDTAINLFEDGSIGLSNPTLPELSAYAPMAPVVIATMSAFLLCGETSLASPCVTNGEYQQVWNCGHHYIGRNYASCLSYRDAPCWRTFRSMRRIGSTSLSDAAAHHQVRLAEGLAKDVMHAMFGQVPPHDRDVTAGEVRHMMRLAVALYDNGKNRLDAYAQRAVSPPTQPLAPMLAPTAAYLSSEVAGIRARKEQTQ